MLVSVVITTHKREPKIVERALQSVLNQTYSNIEVFVVDDSPADYEHRGAVAAMVREYEKNGVTYIPHEACKGACAARNTGLSAAKGEFIGFLDDDDEWLPKKTEEQLKGFVNDNIALVYCASKTIYDDTGEETLSTIPHIKGFAYEDLMIKGNFIGSTSFPLIRTDILKNIGGFDPQMPSAQDYDVWLRLSLDNEINFVDKPLVAYHFHSGEQITSNPAKKVLGLKRIIIKNQDFLNKTKKAWVRLHNILLISYMRSGEFSKAFLIWIKVFLKDPFAFKRDFCNLRVFLYCLLKRK